MIAVDYAVTIRGTPRQKIAIVTQRNAASLDWVTVISVISQSGWVLTISSAIPLPPRYPGA
jgi:hypothetical protein